MNVDDNFSVPSSLFPAVVDVFYAKDASRNLRIASHFHLLWMQHRCALQSCNL